MQLTVTAGTNTQGLVAHNGLAVTEAIQRLAHISIPKDGIGKNEGGIRATSSAVLVSDGDEHSTGLSALEGRRESTGKAGEESNEGELHIA